MIHNSENQNQQTIHRALLSLARLTPQQVQNFTYQQTLCQIGRIFLLNQQQIQQVRDKIALLARRREEFLPEGYYQKPRRFIIFDIDKKLSQICPDEVGPNKKKRKKQESQQKQGSSVLKLFLSWIPFKWGTNSGESLNNNNNSQKNYQSMDQQQSKALKQQEDNNFHKNQEKSSVCDGKSKKIL